MHANAEWLLRSAEHKEATNDLFDLFSHFQYHDLAKSLAALTRDLQVIQL